MVNRQPDGFFAPTKAMIIAARAGLGLSASALAKEAQLGVNTVRRAEAGGLEVLTPSNAARLVETLERLGIVFLAPDDRGAPGLRLPPR